MKKVIERVKPTWKLLSETKSDKIDILFKIYSTDKAKAKIYYHLNKGHFSCTRKVLFEWPNGDFKYSSITKTYGISINNKMFHSEKTNQSIIYKSKNFYYYNNTNKKAYIRTLDLSTLHKFSDTHEFGHYNEIKEYMTNKFGWMRFLEDNYLFWLVSFNVIQKKKLFSTKAMLRHIYQCPYPPAKIAGAYTDKSSKPFKYIKVWKQMRKQLLNIESLREEMMDSQLFQDSCRMGEMVGEKVNCSWSMKRLKSEHDKWTKIVIDVMLEHEPLKELSVGGAFSDFGRLYGYEVMRTNHELIAEGKRMNHCVGTYSSYVDAGECGIYHINDGTLDLRQSSNGDLYISQYMEYGNIPVSTDKYKIIQNQLIEYNKRVGKYGVMTNSPIHHPQWEALPF